MQTPSPENQFQADHAALMMVSYERLLGRALAESAEALYHSDAVVLSHDGAEDPVLTYGNLTAQTLWEMGWDQLTSLPSRLTAEPAHRAQRDAMFAEMRTKGFIENYHGIRISDSGTRFEIRNAVIWPLFDAAGVKRGEAASFTDWQVL
ncbi:MAG: MEKHLA domain-containing protein [Pseudomonadota bacterium]|jgi:hypothetical protein|nr:MEKHLA domain-containing protein [Pseudomonadota bacterium]MEC8294609.1 MEKHLA domain-containing protein [Pseudomonadota bacterium]